MGNKRIGCLSTSSLLAGLITLIVVTAITLIRGGVLFSPGALNAQAGASPLRDVYSHADLETDCSACHTAIWEGDRMADRCLDCHSALLSQPKDFHGIMLAQAQRTGCFPCHTDHRGAQASLTRSNVANFPHQQTGFSLAAHQRHSTGAAFQCTDCHGDRFSPLDQAVCERCHSELAMTASSPVFQTHLSNFGAQCLDCHDGIDTYGHAFDHNSSAYKLEDLHSAVLCRDCHSGARSLIDLKSTPQNCYACHAKNDEHAGQFGQDCAKCHSPKGWAQAAFDHSLTAFPLEGEHANTACQACHPNRIYTGTATNCFACHAQDDAHAGHFGEACEFCHTPQAWGLVTFDHSAFAFPLTGKHTSVACESCHVNKIFKGTPTVCYACHEQEDAHQGEFGQVCEACHTTEGWDQATFDHSKSVFPLTGAHAGVACTQCHANNAFKGTPTACAACHGEPAYHQGLFSTSCTDCHTTARWVPAKFTGRHTFPVKHGHANTCRDCHPSSLSGYTCFSCHRRGEMASKHREEGISDFNNCIRCHPTGQEKEGGGGDD